MADKVSLSFIVLFEVISACNVSLHSVMKSATGEQQMTQVRAL